MKCSILESLNERDIKRINARLKRFPMDYENWVSENFSTLAFAVNGLIKSIQASGRNEILPDDLIDIQTEEDQILNSEFIGEDDVIDTNYNGDRVAISRMYRTFTDAIIGLSIFDRNTNKNANPNQKSNKGFENLLNEKIFDFKDSLIRKIAILTGISFTPGFDNAIDFEKKINKALAAFISMRNSGTLTERMLQSKVYKEALDAFTILKNFDKLIKKVTPFVGIKAGLEFGQNPNKYEFVGANTLLDKSWTTKEEVSIDDQVSDVVGILLDYFPEFTKDGKTTPVPISRTGFYQVMSAFRDWMAHAPLATMFPPSGEREIVVIQQNRALLKQAREGNEMALKKLWKRFYEIHNADGVGANFSKNKMRGINNLFDSRLDNQFKRMLWNLAFKTERNVVDVVTVFEGAVSNKQLTDNFKTRQWNSISDVISSRIRTFKYKNPELKKKLFSDYRIDTSDPNNIIIFKGMPYEFTLSLTGNYFGIIWADPTKKFDNNTGKKLIEALLDTLVPEDYSTVMEQLAGSDGVVPSLIDLYGNVLGLVLHGSTEGNTLSWNNEGDPRREMVKLGPFRQSTNKLQTFLGVADGVDVASTHKNAAGNNIAAYSLTSMIHQMDQMALKLQGKDSSFQSNPVLAQFRDMVGKPIVRGDVDIMGKKKAARNLTESELTYVGIVSDFWNSFIKVYKDDDVQYITFQNTTFSDKNTHFKIPYSKHFKIYRDVTLKEAIQGIIDGKKQYSKTFETAIFEQRRDGYQVVLNNLIADILKATENIVDNQNVIALRNAKTNADKINAVTAVLTDRSVDLEKLFRSKGIEFIPDIHAKVNEVLFHAFGTYLLKDKTSFEKRMQTQKRLFVKDLINFGFEMNFYMDPKNIGELRKQLDSSWYNDLTGEVYFYKGDPDGDFELNPMIEAYFYSDVLLSNSYNELLFGRTFFHPAKYKAVSYDPELGDENDFDENGNKTDAYYAHVEASQLLASYKRTVIAGATFHSFLPMKYGISPDINVAVVSDLTADVWNMLGISDVVDALDGSGLSSPYQAYLENLSLLDAKVGWDKKTIFGDNSGRYGAPLLVKWAVYALTNSRRRMSGGSNYQAEHLFKKMHNQPIDAKNIRLEKYYNFSLENAPISYFDREGNPITYSNALYRFDELTGQYYLISDVRSENGIAYWNEYVANENGTIDYKQVVSRSRAIESIYDLDQIFGGARVMSVNPKTKQLEYSDANIEVVAKIICNENLKDKFTGYVINKSACKVGARNINTTSIFTDSGPLWTFKMSLMFGGIQMNADHELAHSDVTEMSQMISALIQNGYFTDEVNEIYKEIGQIVAESLGIETKLLAEENFEGIHLMLGKNLIDEFNSGDKDTIGLAQSYLMKVSKELEANKNNPNLKLRIPFSDPTMAGAFFANVNAGINKKGIRRRYAGIADVLVPSRDMIQTFNIGQGNMMWDDFVDHCRKNGYIKNGVTPRTFIDQKGQIVILRDPITGEIRKEFHLNGIKHPFINQVQPNEISSQDYVIVVDKDGNIIHEFNVDSFERFDGIRHRLPEGAAVYKWTCKPKNLQQLDVTYEVNGKTYSIYDLDSVRASHYISQLIEKYGVKEGDVNGKGRVDLNLDPNKLTAEDKFKWDFIQNTIQKVLPKRGFVTYSSLKRIQTIFDRNTTLSLKRLETDQVLTQDVFVTHKNGNAREWLYRSQVGKTIIDVDPNNYFEMYLKLSSGIRDFADINQYNIPLSMKIALTFDGSLKSLQKIAVDAVQLGLTPEEINDLVKYLRADLNWNEAYFSKLIEEYIPDVIKYNPVKTLNKYNRVFNKQTKHAQVIMGRTNAEKFGIRKGDSLYKIKQLKEKFFSDRILAQGKLPHSRMVDSSTYDVMLTGPNGEKLFVAVKSRHKDLNLEGYRNASDVFEKRNNGSIYYNEQEICTAASKEVYAKPYPGGMAYLMLVDDFSEIEELMESEVYNNQRINYTSNNPADLFLYQYQDNINENGIVDSDIYIKTKNGETIVVAEGTNINDFINSENFTTKLLTENESIKFEENVNYIAKQMWAAFETQLFCIGARIPTQSMQSFMGLEVVGFSDSDVNEVYVPAVQTWLQGSK